MTSPTTRKRTTAGEPDETSVEQGDVATTDEAPQAKAKKGPIVKYTGDAGTREISAADWKRAGVEEQKLVRWNEENDYSVPVSDLSEEALAVLERDPNLNVVEPKE